MRRRAAAAAAGAAARYDAGALWREHVAERPAGLLARAALVGMQLARLRVAAAIDTDMARRARRVRSVLSSLGPAFVKAGQALSTRADLIPPEYVEELSKLQDAVPPFSSREAFAVIKSELGVASVHDAFAEISAEPVAAASLAQVYRARLRPDAGGLEVAVKVQRPGLERVVGMDAVVLRQVAALAQAGRDADLARQRERLSAERAAGGSEQPGRQQQQHQSYAAGGGDTDGSATVASEGRQQPHNGLHGAAGSAERAPFKVDLPRMVDQLVGGIFAELDFIEEARRAERFRRLYCTPGSGITAPNVVWPFTTSRVLVSEWIDGTKLTEVVERGTMTREQASVLVQRGVACSLDQLLEGGLFHADPHPGNLMVTQDGLLCYLDFGLCQELPRSSRVAMMTALVAYVNGDAGALADAAVQLKMLAPPGTEGVAYERADVVRALRSMLEERPRLSQAGAAKGGGSIGGAGRADFQGLMARMGEALGHFDFELPAELSLVARALGSLEGTASLLDPDFEVVRSAYPVVVSRILADRSPEVRAVCGALLLDGRGGLRWKRLERILRAAVSDRSVSSSTSRRHNEGSGSGRGGNDSNRGGIGGIDASALEGGIQDAAEYLFSENGAPTRRALCEDAADYAERLLTGASTGGGADGAQSGADSREAAASGEGLEDTEERVVVDSVKSSMEAASMVWSVLYDQPWLGAAVGREAASRAPALAGLAADIGSAVHARVATRGTEALLVAASKGLQEWDAARAVAAKAHEHTAAARQDEAAVEGHT